MNNRTYKSDLCLEKESRNYLKNNFYTSFNPNGVTLKDYKFVTDYDTQHQDIDVVCLNANGDEVTFSEKARRTYYGDVLIELFKNDNALFKYATSKLNGTLASNDSRYLIKNGMYFKGWGIDSNADYIVTHYSKTNDVVVINNNIGENGKRKVCEFMTKLYNNNNVVINNCINEMRNKELLTKSLTLNDYGTITLTKAFNKKDNGEMYNTFSICCPISLLDKYGILSYSSIYE